MGKLAGRGLPSRLGAAKSRLPRSQPAQRDAVRDRDEPWRKNYKTARWQRTVKAIRKRDQMTCQQTGELLVGKYPAPNSPVVDHIIPARDLWVRGEIDRFFDHSNLQLVSKAWHDRHKQSIEKGGAH
ncbi:HNH endonuclease [Roseovarius pacificus]|uniref:HNH endonuclease n=1 Tax=Roseovarius pacificus TaxID=337701 RepID=UPI00403950B7